MLLQALQITASPSEDTADSFEERKSVCSMTQEEQCLWPIGQRHQASESVIFFLEFFKLDLLFVQQTTRSCFAESQSLTEDQHLSLLSTWIAPRKIDLRMIATYVR